MKQSLFFEIPLCRIVGFSVAAAVFSVAVLVRAEAGPQDPLLAPDSEDVVEVAMNQFLVSRADRHPRVQTYGVSTCVVLTLFDPETGIGFLAHFGAQSDVRTTLNRVAAELRQQGVRPERMVARLFGGWQGWSEGLVRLLRSNLGRHRIRVAQQDVLADVGFSVRDSLALSPLPSFGPGRSNRNFEMDLSTGRVYEYEQTVLYPGNPALVTGHEAVPQRPAPLASHPESLRP